MANYKLIFHFVDGNCVKTSAAQKPEDIIDCVKGLTETTFQMFIDGSDQALLINMENVTQVEVKKI